MFEMRALIVFQMDSIGLNCGEYGERKTRSMPGAPRQLVPSRAVRPKDLGQKFSAMDTFFTRRAERMMKDGTYAIGITSNSTYLDMGGYAE